jgi:flagellar FliJ protein
MKRSRRIGPLHDLARFEERSASRQLADAARELEVQEQQLAQLTGFREEYGRLEASTLEGIDPLRFQNHRAFMDRLAEAIRQQEKRIESARAALAGSTETWRGRRIDAEALGAAIERFSADERRATGRREQRDSDEVAQRVSSDDPQS